MRLNEISSLGYDDLITGVVSECSESIAIFRKLDQFIYRGINYPKNDCGWATSPVNRFPVSSGKWFQRVFDQQLKASGFTALRSNSIFCSALQAQASHYGDLFIIIPCDGFSTTYSNAIYDLYVGTYEIHDDNNALFDLEHMPPGEFVRKFQMRKDDLEGAMLVEHEIYVHGNYYYFGINYETRLRNDLGM